MSKKQNYSIIDVLFAIWNSPIYFTFWFLSCFALVVAAYVFLPRKYLSDAKMYVQVGRSSVGVSPINSSRNGGGIMLQDSRETEVKSVVDLMSSRELASRVVNKIGSERILKPNSLLGRMLDDLPAIEMGGTNVEEGETTLTSTELKSIKEHNKAVKRLMKDVSIENEKDTTVISIEYRAQTPFLAQDVVTAYLEEYQKQHIEINSRQSESFFESQFADYEKRLEEAELELGQFRTDRKFLTVGNAIGLLQKEIDLLRLDRLDTKVKLREAQERSSQITRLFDTVPAFIEGADKRTASLARDKAREALYAYQLEESKLAAKVPATNLRLIALRDAISKAQRELDSIPEEFKQAEKNINSAHQELLVLVTQAVAEAKAYQERLAEIDGLLEEKLEEIQQMNEAQVLETALVRQVDISRKTLLEIADKRAESETINALDARKISNVAIAQPASLIPKKVFPSGKIFAFLGTILSFTFATVMTFFHEFKFDFSRDEEFEQASRPQVTQTVIHSYQAPVENTVPVVSHPLPETHPMPENAQS